MIINNVMLNRSSTVALAGNVLGIAEGGALNHQS